MPPDAFMMAEAVAADVQALSMVMSSTRYFNPAWAPKWLLPV